MPSEPAPLPPYQPQESPLSGTYLTDLFHLSRTPNLRHIHDQIRSAIERLTTSGAIVNERLVDARARDAKSKKRRRDDGEQGEGEDRDGQRLRKFDEKVQKINAELEKKVREMIDEEMKVDQLTKVLAALGEGKEVVQGQQGMSTSDKFRWKVEKEEQKWEKMSMVKKYADNNDYKQFKRSVHEASYADCEEAPPLPPASTWFDDVNSNQRKAHRADTDDDEIQISREKQSLKCPITLLPFKQPVTSKRCPHSFEKDAIVGMIRNSAESWRGGVRCARCPVCQMMLTEGDLADDLVLARKVRREREREERGESVDDDDDDEEEEEEDEDEEEEEEVDGERGVSVVSDTQV